MSTINGIYGARRELGLDDDTARDVYQGVVGKRSLRLMSPREQLLIQQELNRRIAAQRPAVGPAKRRRLDGPYAAKLQALWLDAWHLGIVRNRQDAALLAFIERQTGIAHTRFLRDPADARKAVEALKGWIAREGKVDWEGADDPADAVIWAQVDRLGLRHADLHDNASPQVQAIAAWREGDLDRHGKIAVMRCLGDAIRRSAQ